MNKKKVVLLQILYYIFIPVIYVLFTFAADLVMDLIPARASLGTILAFIVYGYIPLLFALIAVLMRFSLLRWHVDPIAALMAPATWYIWSVIQQMQRSGIGFADAAVKVVTDNNSTLVGVFIVLFFWGLLLSLSFARKKGESISYRLLFGVRRSKNETEN